MQPKTAPSSLAPTPADLLQSIQSAPAGLTLAELLAQHPAAARRTAQRWLGQQVALGSLVALEDLDAKRAAIAAAPQDSTRFEWGHPYKRWSSFFASSSADNLARSAARVYVVSGMADTSVPILSTEVLYAELIRKGRDITMRRILGGNHALMREGEPVRDVEGEYDRIVRWYLRHEGRPTRN